MAWVRWKSRCEAFIARKARTIPLEQSTRKLSEDKQQSTYSRVWISFGDSIPGLYCVAWLMQESVSLRIFVRKKGMNHVQSVKNRDWNECLVGGSSALLKLPWTMKWLDKGDDHLFWQFCEGILMTFSDGSFMRHLNLINVIGEVF
jgi:hypothetical protein